MMYTVYAQDNRDIYVGYGTVVFIANNMESVIRFLKKKGINNAFKYNGGIKCNRVIKHPIDGHNTLDGHVSYFVKGV